LTKPAIVIDMTCTSVPGRVYLDPVLTLYQTKSTWNVAEKVESRSWGKSTPGPVVVP
jgi:hypothetical protein